MYSFLTYFISFTAISVGTMVVEADTDLEQMRNIIERFRLEDVSKDIFYTPDPCMEQVLLAAPLYRVDSFFS